MKLSSYLVIVTFVLLGGLGLMVYQNRVEIFSDQTDIYQEEITEYEESEEVIAQKNKRLEELYFQELLDSKNDHELMRVITGLDKKSKDFKDHFIKFALREHKKFSKRVLAVFVDNVGKFQGPPITSFLNSIVETDDSKLRVRAIKSLSIRGDSERRDILKKYIKKLSDYTIEEQIVLIGNNFRVSNRKDIHKFSLLKLQELLQYKNISQNQKYLILLEFQKISPENPFILSLAQKSLESQDSEANSILGVLYVRLLARYRPNVLNSLRESLMNSSNREIQLNLVSTLAHTCPPKLWDILDQVLNNYKTTQFHIEVFRLLSFLDPAKSLSYLQNNRKLLLINEREIRSKIVDLKKDLATKVTRGCLKHKE